MQMRLLVDLILFLNLGGLKKTFGVLLRGLLAPLFL